MRATRNLIFAVVALVPFAGRARADEITTNNQPPHFGYASDEDHRVRVGEAVEMTIDAPDPDGDPVTFRIEGLPAGMTTKSTGKGLLTIRWKPRKDDVGAHEVVVTATDSRGASTAKTLNFLVEDDWQSYFMPGASYVAHTPVDRGAWGVFQGVSAEILLASWIHRNENRGPSHGRVFLNMDVLRSSRPGTNAAFDLALGFDLSIERNPVRHFLLPYFGMTTGAFIQRDLDNGSVWHMTPLAGVYLFADKNCFITASAGYVLPISAARFDELRGLRATLGANFSLW